MNPARLLLISFISRRQSQATRTRLSRSAWLTGLMALVTAIAMTLPSAVSAQGRPLITPNNVDRMKQVAVLGYGYSTDVAWSPDARTLAVATRAGVLLYNAASLDATPHRSAASMSSVSSVAFSPSGKVLAIGGVDGIVLRDMGGEQERTLVQTGDGNDILSLAFSPDGKTLAAGRPGNTVRLWDVATGMLLAELEGHDNAVTTIAFSANGQLLAASGGYDDGLTHSDGKVRLWNVATGKLLVQIGGETDKLTGVAFSPDGQVLASGSYDNTVRLWDATTGKMLAALGGHTGDAVSVAFSPDGKRLASSAGWEDSAVRVWDVVTGKPLAVLTGCNRTAHMGEMGKVVFSPDGTSLASTCSANGVMVWDVATGQPHLVSQGYTSAVNSVAFSPDGTTLATGNGNGWTEPGSIYLWDMRLGTERAALRGHAAWVRSVAFAPDGRTLVSGSGDRTARLWETATGKSLRLFGPLPDAALSSGGGGDEDGDVHGSLTGYSDSVWSVAFSPDGNTIAIGRGDPWAGPGSYQLWNLTTDEPVVREVRPGPASSPDFAPSVYSLAFSPDGTLLATVDGYFNVALWEVATGQKRADLGLNGGWGSGNVAFSPDGTLLASGGSWSERNDGATRLWRVATGEPIALLKGPMATVQAVVFSPDGKILAAGGGWEEDGLVQLWDTTTWKALAVLKDPSVSSLAFNPDRTTLAAGSFDGTVRLWGVPIQ